MIYNQEPLCGWWWFQQHKNDHTQAEIDALSIEVSRNGHTFPAIAKGNKRGILKELLREIKR